MFRFKSFIALALVLCLAHSFAYAQIDVDTWTVQLNEDQSIKELNRALLSKGLNIEELHTEPLFPSLDIYKIGISRKGNKNDVLSTLKSKVKFIQQDLLLETRNIPNDTDFTLQWGPEVIEATKAWDITTGGQSTSGNDIVVAVIDDGYDLDHEDYEDNIWVNLLEVSGDENGDGCPGECGVDDDGDGLIDEDGNGRVPGDLRYDPDFAADDDENGYVDDIYGANIRRLNGTHDSRTHGTSVAGIIGAKGNNNKGVTGLNWDVKMMLFSETSRISDLIKAYNYVYNQRKLFNETGGARGSYVVVSNLSSGIDGRFADEFPVWCAVYDQLGSVGVLNVCSTTNDDVDIDISGDMPSTCSSPYLIAVNNITSDDMISQSTGTSPTHIDLGAPGSGSYTMVSNNLYDEFGGTSAAAPHVAGSIALLYSAPCDVIEQIAISDPSEMALNMRSALLNGVTPNVSLSATTSSGGRLNVFNSMLELQELCEGSQGQLSVDQVYFDGSHVITLYETPDFEEYEIMVSTVDGQLVYAQTISPNPFGQKIYRLPQINLANGFYIMSIFNDIEIASKAFSIFR